MVNERKFKFELGDELKDLVTGFTGIVMGRTQYFTGCNHYGLCSRKLAEGKEVDKWEWFDETRLEGIGVKVTLGSYEPESGPMQSPPNA
jgi:hypothetical protein